MTYVVLHKMLFLGIADRRRATRMHSWDMAVYALHAGNVFNPVSVTCYTCTHTRNAFIHVGYIIVMRSIRSVHAG